FRPLVLGKLPDDASRGRISLDDIECREIRKADRGAKYETSAVPVMEAIVDIGAERVHSVILYNYPALGLAMVMRACLRLGIPVIVECTEWYGWEGTSLVRNVRRIVESRVRATWLSRRAGNI